MIFKIIITIIILFFVFKLIIYPIFFKKHSNELSIYFGIPGAGKTTFCAWNSKKETKKKRKVYSNVDIKGNYILEPLNDLGIYEITNADIEIDEAGLDFDNRNFKTYPKNCRFFFKYFRHYNCNVNLYSQDLDVDVKIRKVATNIYLVEKSIIPFFIKRKTIKKKIDINEEGEIIDKYYFQFLGTKLIFTPKLWKMFNTTERPKLIERDFKKWESKY